MSKYQATLISRGEIISNLHYGPYSKDWWIPRPTDDGDDILYPICPGMKTITTINHRDFIATIVQNGFEPGYLYLSEALQSNICKSSSEAITSIYQQAFLTKTRLDGPLVMGFDDPEIHKNLSFDIYFHPFSFKVGNLYLTISGIGKSNNPDWNYDGRGYQCSFVYNFRKAHALFFQKFSNKDAIIKIYQNFQEINVFCDTNPNMVWEKLAY
ncbi:hypothetical protein C2G38_2032753 [Gigaspora rosea]|uniref:Uncharacterized protein n=1 Tax=Gigaspora rosea TaxID=44941 RepID=A0A397VR11_9GLOM|nr:hypothetical protein C2G38_2032753 [Gigaspora rosea]CAG8678576.1 19904_t:CDS:1 [Gigaspora rosea]